MSWVNYYRRHVYHYIWFLLPTLFCSSRAPSPTPKLHKHTDTKYTHNAPTAQMATRVSPTRPAGNTRKAKRRTFRQALKPQWATRAVQRNMALYCLSFATPRVTGSILFKEEKLWLTVTRWFEIVRRCDLVCVMRWSNKKKSICTRVP
jgi:hypothetical protein